MHSAAAHRLLPLAALLALSWAQLQRTHPGGEVSDGSPQAAPDAHDGSPSSRVLAGNTDFAVRLYQLMAVEFPGKNIFFSPLSVSCALAMLSLGARAQTQSQLFQGLGFNLTEVTESEIHSSFRDLVSTVNLAKGQTEAHMGSALFLQDSVRLLPEFLNDTGAFYQAQLFPTNFQDAEGASQLINGHVKQETRGRISSLVGKLGTDTVMVLVNFIYFKALWEKPFALHRTSPQDFHVDEQTTVRVPMMVQSDQHHWYLHDQHLPCSVLRMDYADGAWALFILPDVGAMALVEEALSPELLAKWNHLLQKRDYFYKKVELQLPKFSISGSYELDQLLPKLGFTELFSDGADFSGITKTLELKMSKSFHKATLDVDEAGSEAAAGSGFSFTFKSAPMKPRVLRFNRPFILSIFSSQSKEPLFMAKLVNPTEP